MRRSPWLNVVLFLVTCVTTLIAGALFEDADLMAEPGRIVEGLPFSATLMLILLSHEFGHYFASRRHGVKASLPYFIPVPPNVFPLGTMGAVISMRSPIVTRRALMDIGASGPVIGFVLALGASALGLSMSEYTPVGQVAGGPEFGVGSSLMFSMLVRAVLGPFPEGMVVSLHAVAFAGWIGMFVTMLNLLPVGQLDGGHIVYAFLGERQRYVGIAVVGLLALMGLFWPGWLIWAVLLMVIGIKHPPVYHWEQRMDWPRRLIGLASAIIFILTFMPVPFFPAELLTR